MLDRLKNLAAKFFGAVGKESATLEELHEETEATLERLESRDPGFKQFLRNAHGYVVFPSVGKATAVLGGAYGKGEVFEQGKMVGYAAIAQLTLGVQLGGQTFSEVIAFQDKSALDRFKAGRWAFAANASAVLVKAGAAGSSNYERGAAVFVSSEGGMMLEAAIGTQKFFYRPALLGRAKQAAAQKTKKKTKTKNTTKATSRSKSPPGKKTREKPRRPKTRTKRPSQQRARGTSRKRASAKR